MEEIVQRVVTQPVPLKHWDNRIITYGGFQLVIGVPNDINNGWFIMENPHLKMADDGYPGRVAWHDKPAGGTKHVEV